jgi:hypothetical protein
MDGPTWGTKYYTTHESASKMDIFAVHVALMKINEKPISITVTSILKHVFAGRN